MDLTLKLFAVLKDKAGADSVTVRVREGATTAEVLAAAGQTCPAIAPYLKQSRLAVDLEFVGPRARSTCRRGAG